MSTVFVFIFGAVVTQIYLRGPTYRAQGRLVLEEVRADPSIVELGRDGNELRSADVDERVADEVERIQSIPIIQRVIEVLALQGDKGKPLSPRVVSNRLSVDKVHGTDIFQLTYRGNSRIEAATVVNRIMDVYLQSLPISNRQRTDQSSQFIRDQLSESQEQLKQAELALQAFEEEHLMADIANQKKASKLALEAVNQKLNDTRSKKRRIERRARALQERLLINEQDVPETSSVAEAAEVKEAAFDLQRTEQLLAPQDEYQPSHPRLAQLMSQQRQLENLVQGSSNQPQPSSTLPPQSGGANSELMEEQMRVGMEQDEIAQQLQALDLERLQYEQKISQFPSLERRHRRLEQDLLASQNVYQELLAEFNEIQLVSRIGETHGRIVEYAEIPSMFEVKPMILRLTLGFLLGGFMAVGLTLLVDIQVKPIKTVKEAESLFGHPLIGIVPCLGVMQTETENATVTSSLFMRDCPNSPTSEIFRGLHSNIRFLQSETALKTIAVTSVTKDEGKSTVAANLAIALAQNGQKVLVLDADLRRPKQHQIWEIPQSEGLTNVIVGDANIDEVIHPVLETLDVMIAGATLPNPSALIDSHRMKSLLESLAMRYDSVIIDMPPLLLAHETSILLNVVDGVLMTVRPHFVTLRNLTSARKILGQLEPQILGLVANAVPSQDECLRYFSAPQEGPFYLMPETDQQPLPLEN